jgi:hypothetical protein
VDGLETNDPLTNLNSGLSTNLVLGLNSIEEVTVNTTSYAVDQGRLLTPFALSSRIAVRCAWLCRLLVETHKGLGHVLAGAVQGHGFLDSAIGAGVAGLRFSSRGADTGSGWQ